MTSTTLTESLRETISVFERGGEPRTTTEVAEELDLGRRSTYERLERLAEEGWLETKKVGASARVWWRPGPDPSADAPDRKPAGGNRRDDRAQFESLVEAVEEYAIFTLDPGGNVRTWNPGAERIKGYSADEITGEHFSTFYTREDREAGVPEGNLAAAAEEGSVEDEGWRVRADGTRFWANVTITAIREDGDLQGFAKVTRDMTERREYEQRLREEKAFVESLLDSQRDVVYAFDLDGELLRWNDRVREVTGYSDAELAEMEPADFVADRAHDRLTDAVDRILEDCEQVTTELPLVTADGTEVPYEFSGSPLTDDSGEVVGLTGVGRDVTDRKARERQLRRQREEVEDELDDMFERVDEAFFALDDEWRITYVNDRATAVLERSEAELVGRNVWNAFPEFAGTAFQQQYERAAETGESVSFVEYFGALSAWFEVNAYPSESGLSVYFRDVTDRVQRERELERYESIVQTVEDGIYVVDENGRFTMVNDSYAEMVGLDRSELLGEHVSAVVDEGTVHQAREIERELRGGDRPTATLEARIDSAAGSTVEAEATFTLLPDGDRVGVVRDVTDRKQRERDLERYETLFEESKDVNAIVDADGTFRYVTPSARNVFGYDPAELVGEVGFDHVHPDDRQEALDEFARMIDTPGYEPEVEFRFRRADGSWIVLEALARDLRDDPDIDGVVIYTREVTERRERERELQESRRRLATIVENFPNGAVALVDDDLRYVTVGGSPIDETGATVEELEGAPLREALPPELADLLVPHYEDALDGESSTFEAEIGGRTYQFHVVPVRGDDGDAFAAMGTSQDVTARREYERALERRVRQQEVVTRLGQHALEDLAIDDLMAEAAEAVAETLDVDYCKVLDLDDEGEKLLLRQGVGWHEGVVGTATVSAVEDDSQAAYTLASEEPVVVEDLGTESRFSGPTLLTDHDVRSGISTLVGPTDDPWGILGTHDTDPREFSEQDVNFVQSVANILGSAIKRHEDERELRRQREQLAALNNLNEVVRGITDAVIDQSSRDEIEATVCERLTAADSYEFAWIGDVDVDSRTVRVRTEAGVEGYLDDVTVSVDPDDERSRGPTGMAFRTGEVRTVQDVTTDPRYQPWRDRATEYGYRSSAAIPIVHEGTVYGVLNVYADRPNAFEDQERALFGQLGEVVGHAIAATERKRALTSDEVVELGFRIRDVPGTVGADGPAPGRITIDHAVPVDDGEYLVYGRATDDAVGTLERLADSQPSWGEPTLRGGGDETRFEIRVTDPPVLSTVASLGGYVETAVIEDGELRMTVHLAPSGDVRRVVEVVEETYPGAELLKQRQVTRRDRTDDGVRRSLTTELTDRQRAALEAAFHAGFFEWPREATGEDVAESLGVSPPTFHQHLRKAERKLFGSLLASSTSA